MASVPTVSPSVSSQQSHLSAELQQSQQSQQNQRKPEWDLLLSAAQKNLPNQIRTMIVQENVPPSYGNVVGQTALHIAALWGNVDSVRVLVELGANVNAANTMTGATPLHMITQSQKVVSSNIRKQVIDILLDDGNADPTIPDKYGILPITYLEKSIIDPETAIDEITMACIERLRPQDPPIIKAIQERDISKLESLVVVSGEAETVGNDSNHTINKSYRNQTPLSYTIRTLLQEITNIHEIPLSPPPSDHDNNINNNNSPIEVIISMIRILVQNGADANCDVYDIVDDTSTIDNDSKKPALHAILCTIREYYKLLLPNEMKKQQETDIGTVQQALDDTKSNSNMLVEYKISQLQSVVQLLITTSSSSSNICIIPEDTILLLHQAARYNEYRFIKDILLSQPLLLNVNSKGRQNMTALHIAARSGKVQVLELLLQQPDIDIHATDDQNKTALDYAKINGKEDIVQLLESFQS